MKPVKKVVHLMKVRQLGGCLVVTLPRAIVSKMKIEAGNSLRVTQEGDKVQIAKSKVGKQ